MSASTDPAAWRPPALGEKRSVREWLDALARGDCDQAAFTQAVDALVQASEDDAWEVLALLDQYFRRGKIPADQFRSLKAHVDRLVLGSQRVVARGDLAPPAAPRPLTTAAPAATAAPTAAPTAAAPTAAPMAAPAAAPVAAPAAVPALAGPAVATPTPGTAASRAPAPAAAQSPEAPRLAASLVPTPPAAATFRPGLSELRRAPAVGDVLRDRYELVGVIGKGGMGTVYEAIDRFRIDRAEMGHKLAIKVLHSVVLDRPELFDELRSEFQHLQSLSHPHIVRVHEFDRDGDTAFFTMELLHGVPLSALLAARKNGVLPRPHALALIRDIGAAVAHAHSRNVVHGDLNPQNIFVTQAGEVRVLDFGASHKLKQAPWVSDFEDMQQPPAATPAFGSCQLLEGETADVRDDVFAFACVSYMLLTGKHPFQSRTAIEARSLRLHPKRPPDVGARQWRALQAGLAFERDKRPADMHAWLREWNLRRATPHLPPLPVLMSAEPRRGQSPVLGAVVIAIVVLLGLAVWSKVRQASLAPSSLPPPATSAAVDSDTHDTSGDNSDAGDTRAAGASVVEKPSPPPTASTSTPPAPASAASMTEAPAPPPRAAAPVAAAPAARISLAAAAIAVSPLEPMARVTVRRKGNLRGDVSFLWWTESGTAKPGVDFASVAPQLAHIPSGKNATTLLIPLISDRTRRTARSFYVVIDDAGADSGARIVGTPTTMVTIADEE